jgi:hypothetical protein
MDIWLDQQDFLTLSQNEVNEHIRLTKNARRKRYAVQFENGIIDNSNASVREEPG